MLLAAPDAAAARPGRAGRRWASRSSRARPRRSIASSSRRSTRRWRARAARPTVMGTISQAQILLLSGGVGGLGLAILWHAVNPAHDVAHARHLRRLRDHLHGDPQARHAAEHRDRRRLGRDAAGARMGGDRPATSRSSRCCSSSSSSRGRRRTSGRSRSIAARSTRAPACRCCRSRTARRSRACTCCSTR